MCIMWVLATALKLSKVLLQDQVRAYIFNFKTELIFIKPGVHILFAVKCIFQEDLNLYYHTLYVKR